MRDVTTNHHVKQLREFAAAGKFVMDVADALSWDYQRVLYWEKKLGISLKHGARPKLSKRSESLLRQCADAGMTIRATAERMGWRWDRVWIWERKLGLQFRRQRKMKK